MIFNYSELVDTLSMSSFFTSSLTKSSFILKCMLVVLSLSFCYRKLAIMKFFIGFPLFLSHFPTFWSDLPNKILKHKSMCQFSEFRRAQTCIETCLILSLTTYRHIFGSFVLWVLFSMPAFFITSPLQLTLTLQEIKLEHSGFNGISEKMKGKGSREHNYCLGGSDKPWPPQPFFFFLVILG